MTYLNSSITELHTQLTAMQMALNAVSEAIVWTNKSGNVQWSNQAFNQLIGQQHLSTSNCNLAALLPLTLNHQAVPLQAHPVLLALNTQRQGSGRYEYQRDNTCCLLNITWNGMPLSSEMLGAMLVIQWVSSDQPIESRLHGLQKHVEANTSHDCYAQSIASASGIADSCLMEMTLQESQSQFLSLAANLPGAIYRCLPTQDWQDLYISNAIETITGYCVADLLPGGKCNYTSLIHPDDRPLVERAVADSVKLRQSFSVEYRIFHADGSVRWIYEKGRGFFNEDGEPLYLDGVLFDISDRKRAEDELYKGEARQQALLEAIPDLILQMNRAGVYLGCKPSKTMELVLPADSLIGKSIYEVMPLGLAQQRMHYVERALQTNEAQMYDYQMWVNEKLYDVEARIVVSGEDEVLVIIRDITVRKQAEAEIQHHHRNLELIAEVSFKIRQSLHLDDILQTTVTEVQKLLQADRVLILRLLPQCAAKVTNEAVADENLSLIQLGITDDCFTENYLEKYRQGGVRSIPNVDQAEIEPCLIEFLQQFDIKAKLVVPIFMKQELWGLLILHQCSYPRDWTSIEIDLLQQLATQVGIALAQAQLMEALQDSKEKFRNLVEQTSDLVWEVDRKGHFTYMNPKVYDLLGYDSQSILGEKLFALMTRGEIRRFASVISPFIQQQAPFYSLEKTLIHKDKRSIVLETSGSPIINSDGEFQGYRGIARDITERKQAEQETRNALAKEKELNELKSRFISIMSHEFRTPLSAIMASAELLEYYGHRFTQDERLEQLHLIQESVDWLTQLLEDILIIGKVEAGKLHINLSELDLVSVCRKLINKVRLTTGRHHVITASISCDSLIAILDEKMIQLILMNLVSNAIKYSPHGSLIHLQLNREDNNAVFLIQDHGIGIPPNEQFRLFESFYRATNVGAIHGTGLGLAIVKQYTELLKGQISVESEVGVGTTFQVILPLN